MAGGRSRTGFQPVSVAAGYHSVRRVILCERHLSPHPGPLLPRGTAIELSSAAGPHWQALNLNPNRNLARLRFLEIKSKITIKIGKKPFRLNSMAVPPRRGRGMG